jgi:hypothetical protein
MGSGKAVRGEVTMTGDGGYAKRKDAWPRRERSVRIGAGSVDSRTLTTARKASVRRRRPRRVDATGGGLTTSGLITRRDANGENSAREAPGGLQNWAFVADTACLGYI